MRWAVVLMLAAGGCSAVYDPTFFDARDLELTAAGPELIREGSPEVVVWVEGRHINDNAVVRIDSSLPMEALGPTVVSYDGDLAARRYRVLVDPETNEGPAIVAPVTLTQTTPGGTRTSQVIDLQFQYLDELTIDTNGSPQVTCVDIVCTVNTDMLKSAYSKISMARNTALSGSKPAYLVSTGTFEVLQEGGAIMAAAPGTGPASCPGGAADMAAPCAHGGGPGGVHDSGSRGRAGLPGGRPAFASDGFLVPLYGGGGGGGGGSALGGAGGAGGAGGMAVAIIAHEIRTDGILIATAIGSRGLRGQIEAGAACANPPSVDANAGVGIGGAGGGGGGGSILVRARVIGDASVFLATTGGVGRAADATCSASQPGLDGTVRLDLPLAREVPRNFDVMGEIRRGPMFGALSTLTSTRRLAFQLIGEIDVSYFPFVNGERLTRLIAGPIADVELDLEPGENQVCLTHLESLQPEVIEAQTCATVVYIPSTATE